MPHFCCCGTLVLVQSMQSPKQAWLSSNRFLCMVPTKTWFIWMTSPYCYWTWCCYKGNLLNAFGWKILTNKHDSLCRLLSSATSSQTSRLMYSVKFNLNYGICGRAAAAKRIAIVTAKVNTMHGLANCYPVPSGRYIVAKACLGFRDNISCEIWVILYGLMKKAVGFEDVVRLRRSLSKVLLALYTQQIHRVLD